MLNSLGEAVEQACGISSPTRRKRKKTRSARSYGPVRVRTQSRTASRGRRTTTAKRRRY